MMSTPAKKLASSIRRYQKLCGGVGILTAFGLVLYEKHRIHKFLSKLVDRSNDVEVEKRIPDYIYIKYHIYRESMRILRQQQEEDKNWINIITHPVGKWWRALKHSVAWRLLNIAQTGSQHERLKAVRQLAKIDHLKDWDFRHLAQICDARTAVSLARSGCDTRWFLPVHMNGVIRNPKLLLADLYKMLVSLKPNACVDHFLKKYFNISDPDADVDEYFERGSFSSQDSDMLKETISFLHHITKDVEVSSRIIKDGGLLHLIELRKIFTDDFETLATLCKTLANMSLAEDCVNDFFLSGWIGVLANWQQSPDIRLQVVAAKTMANLDLDDPDYSQYPPNIYPLHPLSRTRCKPKGDIVFIHGLMGGVFITWRQKDRVPTELGLYGKNAFYTSETDDVFLVGETKRGNFRNGKAKANNKSQTEKAENESTAGTTITHPHDHTLITAKKDKTKIPEISDIATKELIETLQTSAELSPEWEVVHPDIPIKANQNCQGEFSVSGNEWKNQDNEEEYTNCWPMEWLPENYPATRILGIDYTSAVTEWSANFTKYCPCEKNSGHIETRATTLLERIAKSDVGADRPVVWIGHSMGGILCKLILLKALDDTNPQVQQVAKNTKGIVFLGTPHRGSSIAKWKQHMQMILSPSIEVKEMEEGAPRLLELHCRFMECLRTTFRKVNVVSIVEGNPTMLTTFKFPLRIVTEESARIDHGDFYILKDDHLSLSKPVFRQSFLYQRLLQAIDESLKEPEPPQKKRLHLLQRLSYTTLAAKAQSLSISSMFSIFPTITVAAATHPMDA